MPFSLGDKTTRVIRFLLGLRNPRIATALSGYGFKQEDMAEGWALVNALGKGKLSVLPTEPRDMETLLKLDAWENQWFPIAAAALQRRFPAAAAKFFLNLQQTEGPEVAISVRTFTDRYDELAAGNEKYGAEGKKAHELLTARGLTPAVVGEGKALLTSLTQIAPPGTPVSLEEQEAELERAEAALWAWYLEWGQIARVAVKQRVLLKQLGFLSPRKGAEEEEEELPGASPTPTPATPPAPGAAATASPNGGAAAATA
jgi:hypothetical protein